MIFQRFALFLRMLWFGFFFFFGKEERGFPLIRFLGKSWKVPACLPTNNPLTLDVTFVYQMSGNFWKSLLKELLSIRSGISDINLQLLPVTVYPPKSSCMILICNILSLWQTWSLYLFVWKNIVATYAANSYSSYVALSLTEWNGCFWCSWVVPQRWHNFTKIPPWIITGISGRKTMANNTRKRYRGSPLEWFAFTLVPYAFPLSNYILTSNVYNKCYSLTSCQILFLVLAIQ